MKRTVLFLTLVISQQAFSKNAVGLNAETVSVGSASVIVERNASTPGKVTIKMPIPKQFRACIDYDTTYHWGANGSYCGYDSRTESVQVRYCDWEDKTTGKCGGYIYKTEYRTVNVPRSCEYPVTTCVEYGTETRVIEEDMTLEFRNLHVLAGSEVDQFKVSGRQKRYGSSGVIFEAEALETVAPVKVRRGKRLFGRSDDDFVVEAK